MNRTRAQLIIGCLQVGGPTESSLTHLQTFSPHQWEQALDWLDPSGLTLYFWHAVKGRRSEKTLPPEVRARLAQNDQDNRARVAEMAEEFDLLNRRFEAAGLEYAVLKGFALIPDYCPDAAWRTQYDYDYLIPPDSLRRADEVLRAAGYVAKNRTGDPHRAYFCATRPPGLVRGRKALYSAQTNRTVELHLSLWHADWQKISLGLPEDFLSHTCVRSWQGLHFRALADEDALLFQALHAFRHILHNWCRLSVFLEVAHLLARHSADTAFWGRFEQRVRDRARLPEVAGVVFSLATSLFGPEIPAAVAARTTRSLPPPLALWVERYGRDSALQNFAGNKFSLFLHREFMQDEQAWRHIRRQRLFPFQRPRHPAQPSGPRLSSRLAARWEQALYVARRLGFHLAAALRYAWECPRWDRVVREKSGVGLSSSLGAYRL